MDIQANLLVKALTILKKIDHLWFNVIFIEVNANGLFLIGGTSDFMLRIAIPVHSELFFDCWIDPQKLISFLKKNRKEIVSLSFQEGQLTITTSKGSISIPSDTNIKTFNVFPEFSNQTPWFDLNAKDIGRVKKQICPFAAKDETKQTLQYIGVSTKKDDEVRFYSTDGHRLSRLITKTPVYEETEEITVLHPLVFNINEIGVTDLRLFCCRSTESLISDNESFVYLVEGESIDFSFQMVSKNSFGQYPQRLEDLIPKDSLPLCTVKPEGLQKLSGKFNTFGFLKQDNDLVLIIPTDISGEKSVTKTIPVIEWLDHSDVIENVYLDYKYFAEAISSMSDCEQIKFLSFKRETARTFYLDDGCGSLHLIAEILGEYKKKGEKSVKEIIQKEIAMFEALQAEKDSDFEIDNFFLEILENDDDNIIIED